MYNLVNLIGRIYNEVEEKDGKSIIKIAVSRGYKNESGIYEQDLIPIELRLHLKESVLEYCKVGDSIGVKGKLEVQENNSIIVVADRVVSSSSKKEEV